MSTQVVGVRLDDVEASSLAQQANRLHRTQDEAATLLLTEKLREERLPLIDFRSTPSGRDAFMRGTRVKVWRVAVYAKHPDNDAARIAALLRLPEQKVQSALDYAAAYPGEIDAIRQLGYDGDVSLELFSAAFEARWQDDPEGAARDAYGYCRELTHRAGCPAA